MFEGYAFGDEEDSAKDGRMLALQRKEGACIADGLQQMQDCTVLFEEVSSCRFLRAQERVWHLLFICNNILNYKKSGQRSPDELGTTSIWHVFRCSVVQQLVHMQRLCWQVLGGGGVAA